MKTDQADPAKVLLSVVVPTMDRQELLAKTLASIGPQLSPIAELVVLDGGKDSQSVKEMVEKAGGRYAWQKPRGFDQAYVDAVEMAKGEYIWLFGDDDLIKPGAIEEAIKVLKKCNSPSSGAAAENTQGDANGTIPLDLLVVNAEVIGSDPPRVLKERWVLMPEKEYGLADRSKVVAELGATMSFMGSVIIRKGFWSQGVEAAKPHLGKRLITMIAPLMLPARRVHFLPSVLVSGRFGHQSWIDTASILIGQTMTEIIWSLEDVEDYAKQACTPRPPFWHILFLWRAQGQQVGLLPYTRAKLIGAIPAPLMRFVCRTGVRLLGKTDSMTGRALGF